MTTLGVKKYRVKFVGRQVGALGISGIVQLEVEAPNEEAALLRCYETHEHIHGPRIECLGTLCWCPNIDEKPHVWCIEPCPCGMPWLPPTAKRPECWCTGSPHPWEPEKGRCDFHGPTVCG